MPYSKFTLDQLILRDHLAMDRTILANERTLLSYLRTAIMLLVSGVTVVKLFPGDVWLQGVGIVLIPGAFMVGILGMVRYRAMHRRIGQVGEATPEQIAQAHDEGKSTPP